MGVEGFMYRLEDGVSMPFIREGELYVYCMICDETVAIKNSTEVGGPHEALRACKKHYARFGA